MTMPLFVVGLPGWVWLVFAGISSERRQIDFLYGLIGRSSCGRPELAIIGEVVVEGCNVEDTIDDGSAGKHSFGL